MGWFGVLAESTRPEDAFTVAGCHLNWWVLPTLIPGRRLFLLDVGLHVRAPAARDLSRLILALPFDAEQIRWEGKQVTWAQDLFDVMRQSEVCHQVFGGPVQLHDTHDGYRVEFSGGSNLEFVRVLVGNIGPLDDEGRRRPDLSLWELPLESPIPQGSSRYLRFRISVFRAGKVWRWKRVWFGKSGAQIDLRISDVREALREERERLYWPRVMPIEQVNVFFIVPDEFQATVASPPLHYVRLLEAGQWGSYLRGARYRPPVRGLRVHYWRHPAEASYPPSSSVPGSSNLKTPAGSSLSRALLPITIDDPFRVFLDLSRDIATPSWVAILRTILAVLVGIGIFRLAPALRSLGESYTVHAPTILKWALGSSATAIVAALAMYKRIFTSRFRQTRLLLRRIERALLRPFMTG